jgi:hypothetical protein
VEAGVDGSPRDLRAVPRGPSTLRRAVVVVGGLLLPLAAIVLVSAALLRAHGWTGATLVLVGALLLTVGIGLVSKPAHAEHLAVRLGRSRHPRTAGPGRRS